jgi:D-alanyl-lipoteichoic acid acyltransferase DltB (MBOAT superfamily)
MEFNGYTYLLFLAAAVGLFWAAPARARRYIILCLSLTFYASWGLILVVLPVGISTLTYIYARIIVRSPEKRRAALWCGIGTVLAILAYFKYRVFLVGILGGVTGLSMGSVAGWWKGALPLGISFYSFEAVSYLLDVKKGRVKEIRFLDLLLFVMFWPHLLAGPIVRVRELVPQLGFSRKFEPAFLTAGLDRIVVGLVQKNVFANSLAGWVDDGFLPKLAATNTTIDAWTLAMAFGLQIYFDFAAYSNIAIGSAQLIGVTLPENFRTPYWAANPSDFWARWHMTLSRWVRDYLFFPLNAKYRGKATVLYPSLIAVMGLVGLWHGAGWGFILWGVMHGTYLVLYRLYEAQRGEALQAGRVRFVERLGVRVLTLVAVTAAWIAFRSSSMVQAGTLLGKMFGKLNLQISYSVNFYLVTALLMAYCVVEPFLGRGTSWLESKAERSLRVRTGLDLMLRPLIYSIGIVLFLAFDSQDTQFIYFQF